MIIKVNINTVENGYEALIFLEDGSNRLIFADTLDYLLWEIAYCQAQEQK